MENKDYKDAKEYLKTSLMFNLSLSSNELFHSNFLYWIWKSNPDAFKQIINGLVGEKDWWEKNCENKQIEVRREYKNFDLCIIEVANNKILFVLENKVKSIPYAQQLKKYKDKIDKHNKSIGGLRKVLLSLSDTFPDVKFDESNNFEFEGWKRKSYDDYLEILSKLNLEEDFKVYLEEYCDYVKHLIVCVKKWDRSTDLTKDYNKQAFGEYEYLKDAEELRMHAFYYMFNTAKLCCMLINKLSDKLSDKLCEKGNVQLQYFGNEDDSILLSDNKEHDNYFHENKDILVGVGYEYSHQKPILEVKVAKKKERCFYIIQIQDERYEHGIIKKCTRAVLEPEIKEQNKNFKDWVEEIPLGSASDIFSSEVVLPEDNYNGYNATYSMVYKYRKLNNIKASVENVLNQIVRDVEELIGKL